MSKRQRAISLWQPYASFIAWGIKRYETRSWKPRGLSEGDTLLIHAAKRKPKQYEMRLFQSPVFMETFKEHEINSLDDLPYGAIVCATKFVDVVSTNIFQPTGIERLIGNYQPDRWAWELELIKVAEPPVVANGKQAIWYYEWSDE